MKTRMLMGLIAAAVMTPLVRAQGGPPPARVEVDAVRTEEVTNLRRVTGEVRTLRRSLAAAQVEGLVQEVHFDAGDRVGEGEIIARLDPELATLEVQRANADVAAAQADEAQWQAELDRAQRDLARLESLAQRGSANDSELDAARTTVESNRARRASAEARRLRAVAELALAERRLKDKTVLAPFDGQLVRKIAEVGEWLGEGDAVAEIVSLTEVEARIDVPEHLIPTLPEPGGSVPVRVPGLGESADVAGTLVAVVPSADPLARMFPVRIALENEDERMRPLMSLTAMVPTAEQQMRTTVHKDAVLRDDAGTFVYVAMPSGGGPGGPGGPNGGGGGPGGPSHAATPMRVDVLFAVGERLVIREGGVRPGMQVIVSGNERVFPTQQLIIMNAAQAGAAPTGEGA